MFPQASQHVSLVINAGGDSRRMGAPKPLLAVPPNNIPLLQHMLERLAPLGWHRIIVVANDQTLLQQVHLPADVQFIADAYPGMGALGGIATGLELCAEWALVIATDMPLINPKLCAWLCQQTLIDQDQPGTPAPFDVIMPIVGGKLQPLHALYHVRTLAAIRAQLAQEERMIIRFLADVRTRTVTAAEMQLIDPGLHSFVNVNTPEEWATAQQLMRDEASHP